MNGIHVVDVTAKVVASVQELGGTGIPNANYQKGVRFERERLAYYRDVLKLECVRTAGSHGRWDIIAVDPKRAIVHLVQCKVVQNRATAERLLANHRKSPPVTPMTNIHQTLEVKISGSTEVHSATV